MSEVVRHQITSGPSQSAALLLDLNNDDPFYVLHDGLTLGVADGDEREVKFKLRMRESGMAVSRAISALMLAINRSESYLLWQAQGHSPTWFRIVGTATEMDFSKTRVDAPETLWDIVVSLAVEAAGYGELVTLPPITISNTDLGATIPQEIAGDYPTAARIDVRPLGTQSWDGWRSLVNVTPVLPSCPLGAPGAAGVVVASPLPPVITWEAEAFTPAAGTSVHTSGGLSGGQALKFDETDGTWRKILSGTVPVTPPPGTYQVWARVWRSSTTAGGAQLRVGHFSWGAQTLDVRTAKFNPPAGESHISWIVLGDMSFPGGMPTEGLTPDDMGVPGIQVYGKGLALGGAGGIILIDRFALVPRDVAQGGKGVTALAQWGTGPAGFVDGLWNAWRIDGDYRRTGLVGVTRKWFPSEAPPQWAGGYPTLSPGMRNIVTVLHRTNQTGTGSDDMAKSVEVVISYHPRVAHLAS